jgi:cytoskeletal protein CcmA (bactofilin family)
MQRDIKKSDLVGPYVIATIGLVSAITGIVLSLTYNQSTDDVNLKKITIGESEETSFTLPVTRAPDAGQFLVADDDGKTTWAYALSSNKNLDVNVGVISVKGLEQNENQVKNQIRSIVVPEGTYTLPTVLPSVGDILVAGSTNPAETTWGKSVLIKFDATMPPVNSNDKLQGYAVGSQWFDTVNDNAYVCLDAENSGAVWKIITLEILNQFDATIGPSVGNDNTQGYSIGSQWIDTTADRAYLCVDSSTNAAIWSSGSSVVPLSKYDAISFPLNENDNTQGYSIGSLWFDIINDKAYVCFGAQTESAKWSIVTAEILNKFDATFAPTFSNDSSQGYTIGSQWINNSSDKAYICVDSSENMAVWISGSAFVPTSKYNAEIPPTSNNDAEQGYSVGSLWFDSLNNNAYVCLNNSTDTAVWKIINDDGSLETISINTRYVSSSSFENTTISGSLTTEQMTVSENADVKGTLTAATAEVTGTLNAASANFSGTLTCSDFITTTKSIFTQNNQMVTKKHVDDTIANEVLSKKGVLSGFAELNANGQVPSDQLSLSIKTSLSDVEISTVVEDKEILQFVDGKWKNQTLVESGIEATGHKHTMADITDLQPVLDPLKSNTRNILSTENLQTNISGNLTAQSLKISDTAEVTGTLTASSANFSGPLTCSDFITTTKTMFTQDEQMVTKSYVDGHVTAQVLSRKGEPDGFAELNAAGKIPSANLSLSIKTSLNDVIISPVVQEKEILQFVNGKWINQTLVESGIEATGHKHTMADITDLQPVLDPLKSNTRNILSTENLQTNISGNLTAQSLKISDTAEVTGTLTASSANFSGPLTCSDFITTTKTMFTQADQMVTKSYVDGHVTAQVLSQKGEPDGFAELNSAGKVPSGNLSLSIKTSLNDVMISPVVEEKDILQFVNGKWINQTLVESGIEAIGHKHTMADITDLQPVLDPLKRNTRNILSTENLQTNISGNLTAQSLKISDTAEVTGTLTASSANFSGPLTASSANFSGPLTCSDFITTTKTVFTQDEQLVTKSYVDGHVTEQVLSQKGEPDGFAELNAAGKVPSGNLSLSIKTSLNDVMISPVVEEKEILQFVNGKWINQTLIESGIEAIGHKHTMADITDLQPVLDPLKRNTRNILSTANLQTNISGNVTAQSLKISDTAEVTGTLTASSANFSGPLTCSDFITTTKTVFTQDEQMVTKSYVDGHVTAQVLSQKGQPDGFAELNSNGKIPASRLSLSNVIYKGIWNASTNTPSLQSGTGSQGVYYVVDTPSDTRLIDGISDWQIKDWIIFNGTKWEKVDNTDQVTSVAGRQGPVTLTIKEDLTDVNISTDVTDKEILQFIEGKWVNKTLAESGISETGHTHTISEITDLNVVIDPLNEKTRNITGNLKKTTIEGASPAVYIEVDDTIILKAEEIFVDAFVKPSNTSTLGSSSSKFNAGYFLNLDSTSIQNGDLVSNNITTDVLNSKHLTAGVFDVKQALQSLQFIDGQSEIIYPRDELTNNDRITVSSSSDDPQLSSFRMFDKIYGFGQAESPIDSGWESKDDADNTSTFLNVEDQRIYGDFNIIDLSDDTSTAIITSFEIYGADNHFPLTFYIVGSQDKNRWTKLYYEDLDGQYFDNFLGRTVAYPHDSSTFNGRQLLKTKTTATKYFRYVGILITQHSHESRAYVQELVLYGKEPSPIIDVKAKIEHELARPTSTATLGSATAAWSNVYVGDFDVKQAVRSLQFLDGQTEVKYPLSALGNGSRVFFSSFFSRGSTFNSNYSLFENQYGTDLLLSKPEANAIDYSWISINDPIDITVDGVLLNGHYNLLDLSADTETAIVTSFQIYAEVTQFPINYHIVGSQDNVTFTSLYYSDSNEIVIEDVIEYAEDKQVGFSSKINTTKQDSHFKHVGILIIGQRAFIQELLLYGTEPSTLIDVKAKIEHELARPTSLATLGSATAPWNDLYVDGFNVKQAVRSLQFLDGQPEVIFPLSALTNNTRVTFSSNQIPNEQYNAHKMFDKIYGDPGGDPDAPSRPPAAFGWTAVQDVELPLTVNGNTVTGDYNYIDMSDDTSTAVITSYQIYGNRRSFPIAYHIIGSNDESTWTSLYYNDDTNIEGSYPYPTVFFEGVYSPKINTIANQHFRYVGILIVSHLANQSANVQELLLYGTEPSPIINVKAKIEHELTRPTSTATLGSVTAPWNDLYVGDFDVKQTVRSLQFLDGGSEVIYPLNALTNSDRVISSTTTININQNQDNFNMFDQRYGPLISSAISAGWVSGDNDTTSFLNIDTIDTYGDYNFIDLQPDTDTAIISSFQIYAADNAFPTLYQIVGSNDKLEWTSLFSGLGVVEETFTPVNEAGLGAFTAKTNTTSQEKYFRYIGIIIQSHQNPVRAYVQELLLYGTEPSPIIDVKAKIEHELARPNATATLGSVTEAWSNVYAENLALNVFDVKQAMTSLQFLDGQPEVEYPLVALANNDRITTSSVLVNAAGPNERFRMFDKRYGTNTGTLTGYGWVSDDASHRVLLNIDGNPILGHYNYIDLSLDTSTAVITSFQFYAMEEEKPLQYYIIGSNDEVNWTSLYFDVNITDYIVLTHNDTDYVRTSQLNTTADKHYRYIGIHVVNPARAFVQELLLYGTEPSAIIDVKAKIEFELARPTSLATLGSVTEAWSNVYADSYVEDGKSGWLLKNDILLNLYAGDEAGSSLTTGESNIYIGNRSGKAQVINNHSVALGNRTLEVNTNERNTAIGESALKNNVSGRFNTAVGAYSQQCAVSATGSSNTSVGFFSLVKINTGGSNTAIGQNSGYNVSTGSSNTLCGNYSGNMITTGSENTLIGAQAENDENPSNSVALGAYTNVGNFTNAIAIGHSASCTSGNQVVLGNDDIDFTFLKGEVSAPSIISGTITSTTASFDSVSALSSSIINYELSKVSNNLIVKNTTDNSFTVIGQPAINENASYVTNTIDHHLLTSSQMRSDNILTDGINRCYGKIARHRAHTALDAGRLVSLVNQADDTISLRVGYYKPSDSPTAEGVFPIGITQSTVAANTLVDICILGYTTVITTITETTTPNRGSMVFADSDPNNTGLVRIMQSAAATQARIGFCAQSDEILPGGPCLIYYSGFY